MADDLQLQLLIKAILESKGFDEAKTAIGALADTTNKSAPGVDNLGKKQSELTKAMGGSRGAAADLTRVLLQSIGVTGAAGEAAKAAGLGMNMLAGAAGGVGFALAGAVAAVAFLVPKVQEWIGESGRAEEAQKKLTAEVAEQLPQLEELANSIGTVTIALRKQLEATQATAVRQQREELQKNIETLVAMEDAQSNLQIKMERWVATIREFTARVGYEPGGLANELANMRTEFDRNGTEIDRLSALIERQQDALGRNITLQQAEEQAVRASTKARSDKARSLERELQAQKELNEFQEQQARDFIKHSREDGRERDKADRDLRKREAERILNAEERSRQEIRIEEEAAATREAMNQDALVQGLYAMSSLFGQNKAIAIAAAIAETWVAANRALAAGGGVPLGVPMMLATIATGMANVANIRKAQPGFDDPVNDMLASQLGRKFATDVLQHINTGFGAGLREQAAGQTVNHTTINRGVTLQGGVHLGGFFGASKRQLLMSLHRELIKIERLENRTRLR